MMDKMPLTHICISLAGFLWENRQKVQTVIRRRKRRCLIRLSTICSQNFLFKLNENIIKKNRPGNQKIIIIGKSTRLMLLLRNYESTCESFAYLELPRKPR